jgi:uncharacterized OB-fold protein
MLSIVNRDDEMAAELMPEISSASKGFWDGLEDGELRIQQCTSCDRYRVPSAPLCPYCESRDMKWETAAGDASVFSWIRYHKAYLSTYSDVPYSVITAEFDEGFRMYGRLLTDEGERSLRRPTIGERVRAVVEQWSNGYRTLAFVEVEVAKEGEK